MYAETTKKTPSCNPEAIKRELKKSLAVDPSLLVPYLKREKLAGFSEDQPFFLPPAPLSQRVPPDFFISKKVIKYNSQAPVKPGELKYAGHFARYRDAQALKDLSDDTYIYLIDKRGRVLYSSRSPDLSIDLSHEDARYLATHRSLYEQFKIVDPNVEIVGAGEFKIIHGQVQSLNNKSNTFQGNAQSLAVSKKALRGYGLQITERTQKGEYSKQIPQPVHLEESQAVQVLIENYQRPQYQQMKDVYKFLYESFPSTVEAPGAPDSKSLKKLTDRILEKFRQAKSSEKAAEEESIYKDTIFLISFLEKEGPLYAIERFQNRSSSEIAQMVSIIKNSVNDIGTLSQVSTAAPVVTVQEKIPSFSSSPSFQRPKVKPQSDRLQTHSRAVDSQKRKKIAAEEIEKELAVFQGSDSLKNALRVGLEKLNLHQRELFLRVVLRNRETHEELMQAMGFQSEKDFLIKRKLVINRLRIEFKKNYPEHLNEFDTYINQRFKEP